MSNLKNISLFPAPLSSLGLALEIISHARDTLKSRGLDQWQHGYPNQTDILADIEAGAAYFLKGDSGIMAYFSLSLRGEPAYERIDGQWLRETGKYGVLHRMAVRRNFMNQGVGQLILTHAEALMKDRGMESSRIDTSAKNAAMRHILEKNGYILCGSIEQNHAPMLAYEKLL